MPNVVLETYNLLEKHGVFIHYSPDHYEDGSNMLFSIDFTNQKIQTGWYNDNHEFGDVPRTLLCSLKLALWYLEDFTRIEMINTKHRDPKYFQYVEDKLSFIKTLTL